MPLNQWSKKLWQSISRRAPKECAPFSYRGTRLTVELPEDRIIPSVTTSFQNGLLTIAGDQRNNVIALSVNSAGSILLNKAAIPGSPTLANTSEISISGGGGGSDRISLQALAGWTGLATVD